MLSPRAQQMAGLYGAASRPGLEILFPNPSGGPGAYVMTWSNGDDLCSPTLHDISLANAIEAQSDPTRPLTPSTVRAISRQTALRGLAGRGPQRAAERAEQQDVEQRRATRHALLLEMIRQTEAAQPTQISAAADERALSLRGRDSLTTISRDICAPHLLVAEQLDVLAENLLDLGIGQVCSQARIPRLIARMEVLRSDLLGLSAARRGRDFVRSGGMIAQQIADTIEVFIGMARMPMAIVRSRLNNLAPVLAAMVAKRNDLPGLIERPGWILDGWDQLCQLWLAIPTFQLKFSVLGELLMLMPRLPAEVETWLELPTGTSDQLNKRSTQSSMIVQDGTAYIDLTFQDRIERNELLRAMQ
jgi:hypothetical protein